MTVIENLIIMVGTGYTGATLLVGTTLKKAVFLVVDDLNENSNFLDCDRIEYEREVDYYPSYFYHLAWNALIRPTVAQFLAQEMPNAWFISYYTLNLKPN